MRLQRRSLLKTGIAAAAVGVPRRGRTAAGPMVLHRGNGSEPQTLDPHIAIGAWENNIIGDLMIGFTTEDIEARPVPGCAESWTTSDDSLRWTFKLRPDLKWSDGTPLTSADFVYGWRRIMDPATAAQYASILYVVKNAEAVNTGKLPPDQVGIRAVDELTLEIDLEQPAPFLPGLLTHYTSFPAPPHAIARHGTAWTRPGNMVTNGPYMLAEWRPHDYIKAVKNPHFYDAANVRIDEVYYYPIDDERVAMTRFRSGSIDGNFSWRGFPIDQRRWLDENMPGTARVVPYLGNEYVAMNLRRKPFDDIRVRRAIALGINRELMTEKVLKDGRLPAYSFVPPGIDNYDVARPSFDFADWPMERRKEEARRLLADAGFTAKRPLAFDYKHRSGYDLRRGAVALCAMLREVGIIGRPFANESKVHYATIREQDFDVAEAAWVGDYNDPYTFLYLLESNAGAMNYGGYASAKYDALMGQAKVTQDLKQRALIMARAEQVALDDVAVAPIDFNTSRELVGLHVRGYASNIVNWHRTRWMWVEREGT